MSNGPTFETATSKVWFLRTADDTGGEVHEQRVEYSPDTRFPPTHYHPIPDERFEIESGEMLAIVDGEKRLLSAGETIEMTRGTRHTMRNPSKDEPAVVLWETRPALRTGEFHLAAAGLENGSGLLDRAAFAHGFRDVFRLPGVQGLLLPLLARLASVGRTGK
ncbi:MAG TPA: cupin domain-containing protein [Acidimicrobiia bacterium]|nr:cupin domain-containing protein [Acidimicrobiia bacterium]